MAKSLLLLEVNRGHVSDDLCGGCRFARPSNRRTSRTNVVPGMWCLAFNEWCGGEYARPARVADCLRAEREAFNG